MATYPIKQFGIKSFFFSLLLILIVFAVIFSIFKLSLIDYVKFLAALFIIIYIPGQALLWLTNLKITRMEMLALSLILGMTSSTLVYRISQITDFSLLFILWLAGLFILFSVKLIHKRPKSKDFSFSITWTGIIFIVLVLLIVGILLIDNYRNGITQSDGSLRLNMHYLDGFIRNSVVRELSHSVPPQMPFAAGFPLSYHHSMDLFVSIFYKYLDIGVLDLLHRLTMTFYFALLLLAVFTFSRRWLDSDKAGLFSVFLILFASGGFGYIGGLLTDYASYWGKLFYSFYFLDLLSLNSFLPSISILASGFFCFLMYLNSKKFAWLILTSFLFAAIIDYKMTYAAPILGALGLTSLVYYWRYKEIAPFKVLLLTVFLQTPLILLAYFHNLNGPAYTPEIRFNNWIIFPLVDLKLTHLAQAWGGLTRHAKLTTINLLLFVPTLLGFFVASFGFSFLALPRMAKKLLSFRRSEALRIFLIFFFIIGIVYFFTFSPSLDGRNRNWTNIYVYYLSIIILSLYWSETFISFLRDKKKWITPIFLSSIIILSIPNVFHFMWAKVHYPQRIVLSQSFLDTCHWLNENTEKEAILVHSPHTNYVCYFADRRVVLDQSPHSYLTFHLTTKQIEERKKDIDRFFFDPLLSADVLTKYNVSYVWVANNRDLKGIPNEESIRFNCFSFLGGKKVLKYTRSHALALCFKNQDYSIYEVLAYPVDDQDVYVLDESGTLQRFKDSFTE